MKPVLIISVVVGVFLIVIAAVALPLILIGHFLLSGGAINKATGQLPVNVGNACITPLWPSVTDNTKFANAINQYINQTTPSSPLNNLGTDFVTAGQANGINPAWEINIARKESTFGTHIPPGSFNSFGRTATASQPHTTLNGRNWYQFSSFQASAGDEAAYLQSVYISQGLTTFETITAKYAPPSENNTAQYVADMKTWVGQVMTLASNAGAVTCAGSNTTTPGTSAAVPQVSTSQ
jgi:hypothetical protein